MIKSISDIAVQTTNVKVEHKSDKESIGKTKVLDRQRFYYYRTI